MKVIYMGSPEFSVYGLDALVNSHHQVVAAVSRVDKIKGRKKQLQPTALKKRALELNIPVYTPEKIHDPSFLKELKSLDADVIVVSAFGRILKQELLELLPYGVLNIHGSLLPYYRGASPMNAVLRNGEKETGITIMYMNEGMDEGDILKCETLAIDPNETFDELRNAMGNLGGKMIVECLDLLAEGNAPRIPQEHEKATYCKLLTREDERIHWDDDGIRIHNQIRSLSSEPGAYTFFENNPFKIIKTTFEACESDASPGSIFSTDKKKGVLVAVKGGILYLLRVKPQGKKEMNANDWYRGLHDKDRLQFTTEQKER